MCVGMLVIIGYIINIYFLTTIPEHRNYQWINKVGVVIIPVGSVMGWVYFIDKNNIMEKR